MLTFDSDSRRARMSHPHERPRWRHALGFFFAPVRAYWRGNVLAYGVTSAVLLMIIIAAAAAGCGGRDNGDTDGVGERPTQTERAVRDSGTPPAEPVTYEIAAREDTSFGSVIRITYRIGVGGPLTEEDIRRIAQEIIDDETSRQDVNAIMFLFYLPGTDTTGVYSAGTAHWAPDGDWASADTVEAGDYSTHLFGNIAVGGAFGEVEPSEDTTGLSEELRRTVFKELVAAEDRADAEAETVYPVDIFDPDYEEGNVLMNITLSDELLDEYRAEVRAKYGITQEQQSAIVLEGVTNYWPLE